MVFRILLFIFSLRVLESSHTRWLFIGGAQLHILYVLYAYQENMSHKLYIMSPDSAEAKRVGKIAVLQ